MCSALSTGRMIVYFPIIIILLLYYRLCHCFRAPQSACIVINNNSNDNNIISAIRSCSSASRAADVVAVGNRFLIRRNRRKKFKNETVRKHNNIHSIYSNFFFFVGLFYSRIRIAVAAQTTAVCYVCKHAWETARYRFASMITGFSRRTYCKTAVQYYIL